MSSKTSDLTSIVFRLRILAEAILWSVSIAVTSVGLFHLLMPLVGGNDFLFRAHHQIFDYIKLIALIVTVVSVVLVVIYARPTISERLSKLVTENQGFVYTNTTQLSQHQHKRWISAVKATLTAALSLLLLTIVLSTQLEQIIFNDSVKTRLRILENNLDKLYDEHQR